MEAASSETMLPPTATVAHITEALGNKSWRVRLDAIEHPKATPEHISTALKDGFTGIRWAAIQHPKATPEHITTALKDKSWYVRQTAIEHPNATAAHIDTALKDNNKYVRRTAIKHPTATAAHISTALRDSNAGVRWTVIEHPNATSAHISTALKDDHRLVKVAAIENPNVTAVHIAKALKDEDSYVRQAAQIAQKKTKMKSFNRHLLEFLTNTQRSEFAIVKMTNQARGDTDHFFGVGNDHIKEPLKQYEHDKSEVHKAIEQHLGKDISTSDYTKGITQDKYGRNARIGRMIGDKGLQTQFANDNTRAGSKQPQQHYTTTVRGTEVAGQTNSTPDVNHPKGHSWGDQSCKNIDTGSKNKYLSDEIKHGTVLTRVHDRAGQEIYRATLQPHHNKEGHVAYALNSEYGVKHPSFTAHAHDVASMLSGELKGSLSHKIHPRVYNDKGADMILHPNATAAHIDTALQDEDWLVRRAAIRHPNATAAHIDTVLKDDNTFVRRTAIKHPTATAAHISTALRDSNAGVRISAIEHPNATAAHIDTALKDDNTFVRLAAINHPTATAEHINTASKDDNWNVRRAAQTAQEKLQKSA